MDKSVTKNLVASVRTYLAGIGHPISQVQGYEVVARAQGMQNKHVLSSAQGVSPLPAVKAISTVFEKNGRQYITGDKGQEYRFLGINDSPLSIEEMSDCNWRLAVVVPVDTDALGNIDEQNDYVSKVITGKDFALCDISYEVFPYFYGNDAVAMLVTGVIEEPHYAFDLPEDESTHTHSYPALVPEQSDLMPREDLRRLSELLQRAVRRKTSWFTTIDSGFPTEHKVVWDGDENDVPFEKILPYLHEIKHADSQGREYSYIVDGKECSIDWDNALSVMLFEHIDTATQSLEDEGAFLHIGDVYLGRRVSENVWQFCDDRGMVWRLGFDYDEMSQQDK